MDTLGYRLKKARESKRFSQVEVFKRTGINNKSLSRYEADGTEPDADTLRKLSELYEVSVDWLLGGNQKESVYSLPEENSILRWIKEAEEDFNVNLRDDPVVESAVRDLIQNLAKMKSSHKSN